MRVTHAWHDSRIARGVLKVSLLVSLTSLLPAVAAAQPWADAYKAGDYAKVAELLQPTVIEQLHAMGAAPDSGPGPARHSFVPTARA